MTATGTAAERTGPAHRVASPIHRARRVLRHAAPTLVLGVIAPIVTYDLLSGHTSDVTALSVGAAFPAAATLWSLARTRRADPVALMTLAGIVLGLVGALLFDSSMFLLLRESVVTGAFGLVFLGSLLAARPVTFAVARATMATTPAERSEFDAGWERPLVQAAHRRTTLEWGVAFLVEAAGRAVLAFVLTPGTLLLVSPLLTAAVLGPVALATVRRRRRAVARLAAARAAGDGGSA
jgi:hypothetical protein